MATRCRGLLSESWRSSTQGGGARPRRSTAGHRAASSAPRSLFSFRRCACILALGPPLVGREAAQDSLTQAGRGSRQQTENEYVYAHVLMPPSGRVSCGRRKCYVGERRLVWLSRNSSGSHVCGHAWVMRARQVSPRAQAWSSTPWARSPSARPTPASARRTGQPGASTRRTRGREAARSRREPRQRRAVLSQQIGGSRRPHAAACARARACAGHAEFSTLWSRPFRGCAKGHACRAQRTPRGPSMGLAPKFLCLGELPAGLIRGAFVNGQTGGVSSVGGQLSHT